ncbi:unnamed protein product [Didymodactylos carnosus]|uniref:rRNA adenine N(6)-methyltransferase n=1 Tax=Didymodactylos carnosus TaxID=1234261 RepID=A0A814LEC0_9BILA|nr:unnamed protein product [Didymodactylos carnosus]CAF1062322.1 unnamed protein product [Didymodactylos carnosus]CAF3779734.1 unnamed protein product [Didymodactylos carnosus]CAF3830464.1 unnamed protein product [Didymodactylos carnosus]
MNESDTSFDYLIMTFIAKSLLPPTPSAADLLRMYKLPALRKFAQNFLLDPKATSKLVACAGKIENHFVIEVGPGPGGITRQLFAQGAAKVAAIEKDVRLFPALQILADAVEQRLKLYLDDILTFPIESVISEEYARPWTDEKLPPIDIIGNLPFNISLPLLVQWIKQTSTQTGPFKFGRIPITITLQEEVGGRLVADALMLQRGRLSILCQNWFNIKVKHIFSGRAFVPAAKINVAVMQLVPLIKPLVDVSYNRLDELTKLAFHTRNKPIGQTLALLFPLETRSENADELLSRAKLDSKSHALTLTVEEWGLLAQIYSDIIVRPRPEHEKIFQKTTHELTFKLGETFINSNSI